MLTYEFICEFLSENIQALEIKGNNFTARCPLCGDSKKNSKKKRFHLKYKNENSIYWNCFNCGQSGNFVKLYALIKSISISEAIKELYKFDYDNIKKLLKNKNNYSKEKNKKENKNFSWILNYCISSNDEPFGYYQTNLQKYLKQFEKERQIPNLYVAYKGYYKNRIIIPIFEDDKLIYFQARRINENVTNKYLNPGVEKENIILNLTKFDKNKYIIITEGILDALSLGNQGTTCLGKEISDEFLEKLFSYTDKGIIIALDYDKDGINRLKNLLYHSKFKNSLLYYLPSKNDKKYKDLNELKVNSNIKNIYNYVKENSYEKFEIILKLQLEEKQCS